MYYTHPGCRTSIFGENRAYCIRDFTVRYTEKCTTVTTVLLCRKSSRNWSQQYRRG